MNNTITSACALVGSSVFSVKISNQQGLSFPIAAYKSKSRMSILIIMTDDVVLQFLYMAALFLCTKILVTPTTALCHNTS